MAARVGSAGAATGVTTGSGRRRRRGSGSGSERGECVLRYTGQAWHVSGGPRLGGTVQSGLIDVSVLPWTLGFIWSIVGAWVTL